jgi:predicted RNA methylase
MIFYNTQDVFTAGNWGRFKINNLPFALSEQQINFFKYILQKNKVHTVLDLSCGNGDFAVLLFKWGKKVTVLEPDPLKITALRSKFKQDGVALDICAGEMRDLSRVYRKQCDLIVCLKNSYPSF